VQITVRTLKAIPIHGLKVEGLHCDGVSANDILFVFTPPGPDVVQLGDVLELDHNVLESPQEVLNVTTGGRFVATFRKRDIHDLRLPGGHGTSRFPSPERWGAA
jgi:hypothetical protein